LNVSSLVDEFNNSLNTSQATSEAVNDVFEDNVFVCTTGFGLFLESFYSKLQELNDGQNE